MKYRLARFLSIIGLMELTRRFLAKNRRCVLTFHGIIRGRYDDVPATHEGGLTVKELSRIISWVKSRFKLLTPSQFLEFKIPGVMLTFDDGMANNFTNGLPVLEQYNAPAVWFVSTQHILDPHNWLPYSRKKALESWSNETDVPDKWARELFNGMSREDIIVSARHPLITIGSHTISHPFLTACDPIQLEEEVVESRRQLEEIISQNIDLFAYPTGDYDKRVACAVRDAGYRAAFGLAFQGVGVSNYDIPRIGIYQAANHYLDAKLCGFPSSYWC